MAGDLDRAVAVLGPLEGRIMRLVWTSSVGPEFVVRDIQTLVPELAYTTVMTTLRRLAEKGLLLAEAQVGRRARTYQGAGAPALPGQGQPTRGRRGRRPLRRRGVRRPAR
jgi:hypothetical protein